MNKKLKIILIIIISIIILWGVIFFVDYKKVSNFKEPIFVIHTNVLKDGGSYTGYGLGYRVDVKKNISAENGISLESVEMYMFNHVVAGAISDTNESTSNENNTEKTEYSFCGTIVQVEDNLFFVEPDEGEEIRKSADKIMVGKIKLVTNVKFEIGERVRIFYDGNVMESYPAQIMPNKYESLSDDFDS